MRTVSSPTTLTREGHEAGASHTGGDVRQSPFRGPRPPDSELRAVRGIAYAMIMVIPFWLAIAWAVVVLT